MKLCAFKIYCFCSKFYAADLTESSCCSIFILNTSLIPSEANTLGILDATYNFEAKPH